MKHGPIRTARQLAERNRRKPYVPVPMSPADIGRIMFEQAVKGLPVHIKLPRVGAEPQVVAPKDVPTTCKHCSDPISGVRQCETCDAKLIDQCLCCHNELAHGHIPNSSIHVVGNGHEGLTPRQAAKLGKSAGG